MRRAQHLQQPLRRSLALRQIQKMAVTVSHWAEQFHTHRGHRPIATATTSQRLVLQVGLLLDTLLSSSPCCFIVCFQRVLGSIVQPQPAAVMAASVAAQIAHTRHDPVDVAAMTSLGSE